MTAAQVVRQWYKENRDNETHPFTIPDASLRALVADVRSACACSMADRDAEQLAPPTSEEES